MRDKIIKRPRFYITATLFLMLITVLVFPWNTSIIIPAVYESQKKTTLYSSAAAYIESSFLEKGKIVKTNEVLMNLKSAQLEFQIESTLKEIDILRLQAKRIAASPDELSNIQVIVQRLHETRSKLDGLREKQSQLVIRAPIDGVIYDMDESLHKGRWINTTLALATIVQPEKPVIEGVVTESDLSRIKTQAAAKFIPDNPQLESIWAYVQDIELANLKTLNMPVLASIYGGKIPVHSNDTQQLIPEKSVYRVRFTISPVENVKVDKIIRGVVHIQGETESFIERIYKIVASVLIRESGF